MHYPKHDTTFYRSEVLERVEALASQRKGKSCHTTTAFRSRWLARLTALRCSPRTLPAGVLKKTSGAKLALSATLSLLAGCASPFANPLRAASPPAAAPLAGAYNGDLLYVVNLGNSTVDVYAYPT